MVAHGPAVHPGFSAGVTAALGSGPTYENGDDPGPFYIGALAVNAAYGWRPKSDALPALRVGVTGPREGGAAIDAYLQLPPAWLGPLSAGVGVMAGERQPRMMPYVQVGAEDARGLGAHLVAGWYDDPRDQEIGYWSEERGRVAWLSAQLPLTPWATLHAHAGFASGHVTRQGDHASAPYIDEDRWVRLAGLTVELHRGRR